MKDSLQTGRFVSLPAGAGIACFAMSAALAHDSSALPKGFKTTPLLKSGKTADGDALAFPATAKPEVVSVIGVLEPGGRADGAAPTSGARLRLRDGRKARGTDRWQGSPKLQSWRGVSRKRGPLAPGV